MILISSFALSETTKVFFSSKDSVDVYKLNKVSNYESDSLFPNKRYDPSDLKLAGRSPFIIEIDNGFYQYNIGGNSRYSKSFNIAASGTDITVQVLGSFEKVHKDSIWTLGFGVGALLSLSTVKLITDQVDADKAYMGYILPMTLGCGFCISFGKWLYDKPRVKIVSMY
jgi:hypothetical protein